MGMWWQHEDGLIGALEPLLVLADAPHAAPPYQVRVN